MAAKDERLTQQATASYGSSAAAMRYPNLLLAIVNPLSGERSAAAAVHDAFCASLGQDRVVRLDVSVFKDPSALKQQLQRRAQEHSARLSRTDGQGGADGQAEPLSPGMRRKGTVLVAGGDGTVAFVMNVVQDVFADASGAAGAAAEDPMAVDDTLAHLLSGSSSPSSPSSPAQGAERRRSTAEAEEAEEAVPAVAVFPMGTGNDLSYTLGFGLGFTRNHACAACVCCPRDIDAILDATLAAPIVRFDRWEATVHRVASNTASAGPGTVLHRVGFNNYVSFGMDADIARRFDEGRKGYPTLHRLRTMNKLWYGVHGLTATPFAPKFSNGNLAMSIDGVGAALPPSAHNCKAVVITNVLGYSGGVDLWRMKNPELVELPRATTSGGFEKRRVPLQPGAVGDGRVEVQTLGGLFHMTFLRSGFVGADRVGQGSTVDIVVSDPDGTHKGVRLQADGEPLGEFQVPFRLQVRPAPRGPLYVHCAPFSKAASRSATTSVAY